MSIPPLEDSRATAAIRHFQELARRGGLCTRRHMDLRVDQLRGTRERAGQAFGLLAIDVDSSKKFNDCYRRQADDNCLRAIVRAVTEAVEAVNEIRLVGGVRLNPAIEETFRHADTLRYRANENGRNRTEF